MKMFMMIIFLWVHTVVYGSAPYIICIDGGGSKTALQVIDAHGAVCALVRHGFTFHQIEAPGSNVNTVGIDGVRRSLQALFNNTTMEENDAQALLDILPTSYVVAGMAGVAGIDNKNAATKLFEEFGINKDHLLLASDAVLALHLVRGDGAILIAGTGSICLGKKGNERYRVGGLGYVLGDEGSGYAIGLHALKLSLAHEYCWGKPTSMTAELCKFYGVSDLKNVMQAVYKGAITPVQISRAVPVVLAQAVAKDSQAITIVNEAAAQLGYLVTTMATVGDLSDCEVHLLGGLFKSDLADVFVKKIAQQPIIQQRRINLINKARQNATTLFAQQSLCDPSRPLSISWEIIQKLVQP